MALERRKPMLSGRNDIRPVGGLNGSASVDEKLSSGREWIQPEGADLGGSSKYSGATLEDWR